MGVADQAGDQGAPDRTAGVAGGRVADGGGSRRVTGATAKGWASDVSRVISWDIANFRLDT